jgi:SAM-dependent methyltransferase
LEAARALDTAFAPGELAGASVLDLACGAGRYLAALQARRAHPVGLDLSGPLLLRARAGGLAAPLVRADMRAIPFRDGSFDWTLSMFTSFGYFSTSREHAALARDIARVTRRGAVIDVPNPDVLAAMRKSIRLLSRPGGAELERYEEQVTLFTAEELAALFAPHGLAVERTYGGYDGSAFDPARSERVLLRLRAAASHRGGPAR